MLLYVQSNNMHNILKNLWRFPVYYKTKLESEAV